MDGLRDIVIGDFVMLESPEDADADEQAWLAKVVGIKKEADETYLECLWMYSPADLAMAGCDEELLAKFVSNCGNRERVPVLDESDWNPLSSVLRKITILPYFMYIQADLPLDRLADDDTWFYRTEFESQTTTFKPLLPFVRNSARGGASEIMNPDIAHKECKLCKSVEPIYETSADGTNKLKYKQTTGERNSMHVCCLCSQPIVSRQMATELGTSLPVPSAKVVPEAVDEELEFTGVEGELSDVEFEYENENVKKQEESRDTESTKRKRQTVSSLFEDDETQDPETIPNESKARFSLFESAVSEDEGDQHESVPEDSPRMSKRSRFRESPNNDSASSENDETSDPRYDDEQNKRKYEKFKFILDIGVQELLQEMPNRKDLITTDMDVLARLMVNKIEDYCRKHDIIGRMAHQRAQERYQNLKRENNSDLRRRILLGELSLEEFAAADSKELAPESVKKKRDEAMQKYLRQQVLLQKEESVVLRKTHKGLESVNPDDEESEFQPPEAGAVQKSLELHEDFPGTDNAFSFASLTSPLQQSSSGEGFDEELARGMAEDFLSRQGMMDLIAVKLSSHPDLVAEIRRYSESIGHFLTTNSEHIPVFNTPLVRPERVVQVPLKYTNVQPIHHPASTPTAAHYGGTSMPVESRNERPPFIYTPPNHPPHPQQQNYHAPQNPVHPQQVHPQPPHIEPRHHQQHIDPRHHLRAPQPEYRYNDSRPQPQGFSNPRRPHIYQPPGHEAKLPKFHLSGEEHHSHYSG